MIVIWYAQWDTTVYSYCLINCFDTKKKRHKKLNAVKDEKRGTNEHMLI